MKKHVTYLIILAISSVMFSCGGSGGNGETSAEVSNLLVKIKFPDGAVQKSEDFELVEKTLDDLDTCTIIISGGTPSISEINEDFNIDEPKRVSVPLGNNRIFMFIGRDIFENPICKGETMVDISPDISSVTIGCEFVTEICNDGMDNDFDDLIDCRDPDCDRSFCDLEVPINECIDGECVDPTPEPEPEPTEEATDECPDSPFPRPFPVPPIYIECFPELFPQCDPECGCFNEFCQ